MLGRHTWVSLAQQWPKLRLRFAKLVRIFVANATFFFAFGRIKGSFWTFELALVTNEVPLRIENGQLAPGLPLSMGMPIASGSLLVSRLADECPVVLVTNQQRGQMEHAATDAKVRQWNETM